HRTLMRLYVKSGRRGAALRQYQQCVSTLQRELGTEPEPETKVLYGEILRAPSSREGQDGAALGDPVDRRRHAVERRSVSRTSLSFGVGPRLVGRDPEVADLERALDDTLGGRELVVAIIGEAGVGKTSLLATLDATSRRRGARVLAGRCYESAQVLPFGPWV